jgi:threonyl-tRNA synthetase
LGQELDLFSFPEEIGSGLAVFHPKGGTIRRVMEDYSRQRHEQAGYDFVYSPHITKSNLFETSGHLAWYSEGMFPPMKLDEELDENGVIRKQGQDYYLKPMNCPFHILIYKSQARSYRDLPLRMFEFGSVYRYEKSGVVHGLTRVRGMTQDDAHLFVTLEDMESELTSVLNFVLDLLRDYGLTDFYLELSTRDPDNDKFVGDDQLWEKATSTLAKVATDSGLELVPDPGGAAFYGPKISVQARDAIGRTWQM